MGLIDNDGKVLVAHVVDRVADVGKFLDGGDDDALALLDGLLEFFGSVGMGEYLFAVGKGANIVGNLAVQQAAVGHDHNGIDDRAVERAGAYSVHSIGTRLDELEGEPGE